MAGSYQHGYALQSFSVITVIIIFIIYQGKTLVAQKLQKLQRFVWL